MLISLLVLFLRLFPPRGTDLSSGWTLVDRVFWALVHYLPSSGNIFGVGRRLPCGEVMGERHNAVSIRPESIQGKFG